MSIKKVGTPAKIEKIASDEQFDSIWDDIKKKNEVIKGSKKKKSVSTGSKNT